VRPEDPGNCTLQTAEGREPEAHAGHASHPEPAQTAGKGAWSSLPTVLLGTRGGQECGEKGSSFHAPLFPTFPSRFLVVLGFFCLFVFNG